MYWREYFAGVDEVGRGPLAGAVLAGAVVFDSFTDIEGLRDSKQLSAKKREQLDLEIRERALCWAIGRADVKEIDTVNILQASMLAMQRAVAGLSMPVDYVVVDGNRVPDFGCEADYLVKGDDKLDVIKAASIIAKVARDKEMILLDEQFPEYGFASHKGYATRAHLEALKQYGPTIIHRRSFSPCRQRELF